MKAVSGEERAVMRSLIDVAHGKEHADLVIRGGRLVNVMTAEIHPADVAIFRHRIAAVGDVAQTEGPRTGHIDATGMYLVPGLIDQHVHVHESQLMVSEFAALALSHGTAGIATDFYGEMVVGGLRAVRASVEVAASMPMKVWLMAGVPGYYQNRPFGHSGWPTRGEMNELMRWTECRGISDTSALRVAAGDESQLEIVEAIQAAGGKVTGHGSGIDVRTANGWAAFCRDLDDHECVDPVDAVAKARIGIRIVVREGAGCSNLDAVVKAITEHRVDARRFCFCTDVPSALRMAELGHLDHLVRCAIRRGVAPVTAVQMASLNAAECLHIDDDHGSIAPGKWADIGLVASLEDFDMEAVVVNGRLVASGGRLLIERPTQRYPRWAYGTVKLPRKLRATDFAIAGDETQQSALVRVIVASGTTVLSEEAHVTMPLKHGVLEADPARDVLKVSAVERVRGTGRIGLGLVQGFGLKTGALATTFNSQQQNIIVVGTNDEDMARAANELQKRGGGFIAVEDGVVRAALDLPVFGLLSDRRYEDVVDGLRAINAAAFELGCTLPEPFSTLGFVGLPVEIGALRIAPEGIVDVGAGELVPLWVDDSARDSGMHEAGEKSGPVAGLPG